MLAVTHLGLSQDARDCVDTAMQRRAWLLGCGGIAGVGFGGSVRAASPDPPCPARDVGVCNAAVLAGLATPGPTLRPWQWLVVHHTAAEFATLPGIDRYHRRRFGDELGAEYHFVINNGKKDGTNRPIGLIEVARWRHQAPAWHLFRPDNAPESIAICLVGNFETREVPQAMMTALTELCRALMKLCEIPVDRVSTHRVVDDKLTQCPGRLFPRDQFLRDLAALVP